MFLTGGAELIRETITEQSRAQSIILIRNTRRMEEQENIGTINYRLTNIESTLAELKTVIVENKLQDKEIATVKEKLNECIQAINAHDQRLKRVELAPVESKAARWQQIIDSIFKFIIGSTIAFAAVKIGIK